MNIYTLAALWISLSALYVMTVIHLVGPIRPGAVQQLLSDPVFLVETLLGIMAILFTGVMAFRSMIPGLTERRARVVGICAIVGALSIWGSLYAFNWIVQPAWLTVFQDPMLGKRDHCMFEVLIYAVPPILVTVYFIRRRFLTRPRETALWVGLCAGLMPALYMQLACMYSPDHSLVFHLLPGVAVGAITLGAVWLYTLLRKRGSYDG